MIPTLELFLHDEQDVGIWRESVITAPGFSSSMDSPKGWLHDSCGFCAYFVSRMSRTLLSISTYVCLGFCFCAVMNAQDMAPVALALMVASADVCSSLLPDHMMTSAGLVLVSFVFS